MADRHTCPRRLPRRLAVVAAVAALAGACGSSEQTSSAEAQPPSTVETVEATSAGGATTTLEGTDDSTTDTTAGSETSSTTAAAATGSDTDAPGEATDAYRVAPMGGSELLVLWDRDAVWVTGHTGERTKVADGPFVEVAHLDGYGVAFQREAYESTIWLADQDGVRDLLVAGDGQTLTLEGTGSESAGGPSWVYYQRHDHGSPETTRSALRRYDMESGEVTELLETGGWESGTHFDHIDGDRATAATWYSEAWMGNVVVDLGDPVPDVWELSDGGCFDGEPDCLAYDHAVVLNPYASPLRTIGVGPIWNESLGVIDQFGVFEFDLEAGTEELIVAFPWDNGLWYVEDMFTLAGDKVILSLSDGVDETGDPLPALVVDVDTGEAHTLPEAMFVRPLWLS